MRFRQGLLAALIFASTNTASPAEQRTVMGSGNLSCGAWTQERRARSPRSQGMEAWVTGYATGQNWATTSQSDFLIKPDAAGMFGWIDNYCRSNPLQTIRAASEALISTLRRDTSQ